MKDCLFLLRAAAICAPEEEPAEGISLRDIARMSLQAKHIRVAFTIELARTGLFPPKSLLATIKDLLYRQIRFIDPDMVCLPITESGTDPRCPWTITSAGNAHSSRIQKRIEEAARAREKEQKIAAENARAAERRERKKKAKARKSDIPLWKQRALEREAGQTGTHADRRKKP